MANMSYCRFENTQQDLRDCIEALNNHEISSLKEKEAAKRLFKNFLDFCKTEGIIEEFDMDVVTDIINECENITE